MENETSQTRERWPRTPERINYQPRTPADQEIMQEPEEPKQQQLSNITWGFLIGTAVVIDATQVVLDWLIIGLVANRYIDIVVGMGLSFALWILGVKMNKKKIISIVTAFFLEMAPLLDALPLWTLDVILIMAFEKAEGKIMHALPMLQKNINRVERIAGKVEKWKGKK
jgi:hypothetical protein